MNDATIAWLRSIDHENTPELICPFCGHAQSDPLENGESGNIECAKCEREFYFERDITVTYTTSKELTK